MLLKKFTTSSFHGKEKKNNDGEFNDGELCSGSDQLLSTYL